MLAFAFHAASERLRRHVDMRFKVIMSQISVTSLVAQEGIVDGLTRHVAYWGIPVMPSYIFRYDCFILVDTF